jgi:hypothetical protein
MNDDICEVCERPVTEDDDLPGICDGCNAQAWDQHYEATA